MIKFNKLRIPTIIFSIILILIGLWFFGGKFLLIDLLKLDLNLSYFTPKGLNLGIDFQGGLVHQVTVYTGIEHEKIRDFSIEAGLGSEVQKVEISDNLKIAKSTSYLIKTIIGPEDLKKLEKNPSLTPSKLLEDRTKKLHSLVKEYKGATYTLTGEELKKANLVYPDEITGEFLNLKTDDQRVLENVVKESENVISPVYSKGLRLQALLLVSFVLLIMLVYITFRFKFKYAIGAIAALLHDVLIILGFISVFGYILKFEFDYTIIAAILFIIGYSLNDTIVIFDRIRENYSIMKDMPSKVVINTSINQSLSRTIITSLTTLLAVIALTVWGGPKIFGFSVTLIAGIISGTYSSIFIASPVVDSWEKFFSSKSKRKKDMKKEEKMIANNNQNDITEKIESNYKEKTDGKQDQVKISKKQLKKLSGKKKKK